jgi:hypothetical protein
VAYDCKKAGTKIDKGELRMGVWVEFKEGGSYKWKHWYVLELHQHFDVLKEGLLISS